MEKPSFLLSFLLPIALSLFLLLCPARSQTVPPVFSQTVLQPPYAYRLASWTALPPGRLYLKIRMLDTRVEQATLSLKMKLQSENLTIESRTPITLPQTLSGGESLDLDASDLSVFFSESSLNISGSYRNSFLQSGGLLPDGLYRLYFEVYENRTGQKVSVQEIPAVFSLLSAEPPLLNFPEEESTIYYGSDNIRFQWTPRHLGAASYFQTEYTFEIAEIPEGANNWQIYFHSLPLVHSEKTTRTQFLYGAELPSLIPGRQYAFRVRAECLNSLGENLNIKNDGYSDVRRFSYEEKCSRVPQVRITEITSTQALVSWTKPIEARSFELQYRKNGNENARWFSYPEPLTEENDHALLKDLEPSTGYECRILVKCDYSESPDNAIYRFTTLSSDNAHLDCGNHSHSTSQEKDQTPLEKLQETDQVRAGNGFILEIQTVSGENGRFSGTAFTHVPLLANTGIKVKFRNVFINKNYELVSGVFTALTDKNDL